MKNYLHVLFTSDLPIYVQLLLFFGGFKNISKVLCRSLRSLVPLSAQSDPTQDPRTVPNVQKNRLLCCCKPAVRGSPPGWVVWWAELPAPVTESDQHFMD